MATVVGELRVMTPKDGDYKVTWDRDRPEEVEAARETFERLKKKGHIAYALRANGKQGEVLREFDPESEAIVLAPALAGG